MKQYKFYTCGIYIKQMKKREVFLWGGISTDLNTGPGS